MKTIKPYTAILICALFTACQTGNNKRDETKSSELSVSDNRPKDEIYFLNKVKAESDYKITSNAVSKDEHIKAFNKYSLDSLKRITGWEMVLTEINDNQYESSSFAKGVLNIGDDPVYNLALVAPIKPDKTVDTIAINNMVEFTYTIFKNPKNEALKKQLATIKNLKKGDTVIVAGALTHIDDKLKVNFASFYESTMPWNVDLLLTDIRKKASK